MVCGVSTCCFLVYPRVALGGVTLTPLGLPPLHEDSDYTNLDWRL